MTQGKRKLPNDSVLLARLDERTLNIEKGIDRIESTFSGQIKDLRAGLDHCNTDIDELKTDLSSLKGKWSVLMFVISAIVGLIFSLIGQILAPMLGLHK